MTGSVHPEGRWWARWQRLAPEDRDRVLEDLANQMRGELPDDTRIDRQILSCYPRHALLRFTVSSPRGPRYGFAFYAPGQLYPLHLTFASVAAFNEIGLEIRDAEQAATYLRFATWATTDDSARSHILDPDVRLNFAEPISPELEAAVRDALRPCELVDAEPDDPEGAFRFRTSTLIDDAIELVEWLIEPDGDATRFRSETEPPVRVPVVMDRFESDRYFVLVREESLSADRFVRRLRNGPVHGVRVTDPVVLRGGVFTEPVNLTHVTFARGLDFEGTRFEKGLTLDGCVFEGKLSLADATVHGPLRASGMRFHREGLRKGDSALGKKTRLRSHSLPVDFDGSGMRVEGSVFLEGLRCPNVVDLPRARIGGDLRLGGARIGEPRAPTLRPNYAEALRLDSAEVKGDVDFVFPRSGDLEVKPEADDRRLDEEVPCFSRPRMIAAGTILARRLNVHGAVILQGLRCEGDLRLEGCTIGSDLAAQSDSAERRTVILGNLDLIGAEVGGDVEVGGLWVGGHARLFSSRVGGSVFGRTLSAGDGRILPVRVGGELLLSGMHVNDVDLEGAELGGLEVVTGEIDRLALRPGIVSVRPSASSEDESSGGEPLIARHQGHVGGVSLWDLTIRKRLALRTEVRGNVRLGNVECGGDVEFWVDASGEEAEEGERWAEGEPRPRHEVRTVVDGDVVCTGLEVGGRAVLTNLDVRGRIEFKNCRIDQDLNFQSLGPDPASSDDRTRTTCRHLDLELTSCGGDVDMAGLTVSGADANVHARQLEVTGRILLARPLDGRGQLGQITRVPREHRVQATITGDLDLSVASTAQLVLVGSSVAGVVNLERGRFRRLDVVEPRNLDNHNLSDIEVDRWEIEEEHLRQFLDESNPFARDTYVKVERMLRNKSQDIEADRVYRAMRARAIREAKRERAEARASARLAHRPESLTTRLGSSFSYLLRTTGSAFLGATFGWGTLHWAPLAVLTLLLAPITWNVVAQPENIVSTAAATDLDWGADDAFWLTLRYHVPVVPVTVREDYRPSLESAVLKLPGGREARAWFSAEDWAVGVYLLNWILWPLFLVGLARRVVRETT